jgi:hypothetical protein
MTSWLKKRALILQASREWNFNTRSPLSRAERAVSDRKGSILDQQACPETNRGGGCRGHQAVWNSLDATSCFQVIVEIRNVVNSAGGMNTNHAFLIQQFPAQSMSMSIAFAGGFSKKVRPFNLLKAA